jgi:hypothetical protein
MNDRYLTADRSLRTENRTTEFQFFLFLNNVHDDEHPSSRNHYAASPQLIQHC